MEKDNRSGFAVFIILVGIGILLVNLNILRFEMFWGIAHLWPLLFVLAGLSLLFRKVRHFDIVLWLVFFGVVIGYSYLNADNKSWFFGDTVESVTFEEEMTESEAAIDLDISTGNVSFTATESNILTYIIPQIGMKTNELLRDETPVKLKLRDNSNNEFQTSFQNRNYELILPEEVNWTIDVDGAVINSDLDFSRIKITNLDMDFAVGDLEVIIGEETMGNYNFDFAIGSLTIDVPDDQNIKLHVDGGLNSLDVPSTFTQVGDYYHSKNYDENGEVMFIEIDLAIGSVEIK